MSTNPSARNEQNSSHRPERDTKSKDAPVAGNAQFDPAEQSHRRDMEDEEHNGEAGSFRGSVPPGTDASTMREQTPAIPRTQKDGGS